MALDSPGTIILAIIGGLIGIAIRQYYVSKNNCRKEDRDLIDAINKDIDEVEKLAYKYFSLPASANDTKEQRLEINRIFKRIGNKTYTLAGRFLDSNISKYQLSLKQEVTLGDYESIDREAKDNKNQIYEKISDAARRLNVEMESVFKKKYRKSD